MFVITTPKALMIVPKNTTLSTSSSFSLTYVDISTVNGPICIELMYVLLCSEGIDTCLHVSIYFLIKNSFSDLKTSLYSLMSLIASLIK